MYNFDCNQILAYYTHSKFYHFKRFSIIFYDPIIKNVTLHFMFDIANCTMDDLGIVLKYDGRDLKVYYNKLRILKKVYMKPLRLQ